MAIMSAPGQDRITAIIYKKYADHHLHHKENKASFFRKWKSTRKGTAQAIITQIFKGGEKSNPRNHWSVALTNH